VLASPYILAGTTRGWAIAAAVVSAVPAVWRCVRVMRLPMDFRGRIMLWMAHDEH
jgi:hypothetical protein